MLLTANGSPFSPVLHLRSKDHHLEQLHQVIVLKHINKNIDGKEKEKEKGRSMVTPVDERGNKPIDILVTESQQL